MTNWRRILRFGSVFGRAPRIEFLAVTLLTIIITIGQLAADKVWPALQTDAALAFVIAALCWLIQVSVSIRRMHDIGKSGWLLPLMIVPVAGLIIFLWCAARPGLAEANQFGPAP